MFITFKPFQAHALLRAVIVLCVLGFSACSTSYQARNVKKSGFLGDYSGFQAGGEGQAQKRYIAPNAAEICSKYHGVIIDPVTIWTKGDSNLAEKVSPKDREMLAGLLGGALVSAAGKAGYGILDRTGPRIMRIRAALTEGEQSNVVLDTVTTIIPQSFVISSVVTGVTDTPGFAGKASVEAEIVDSETGKRIIAGVNSRLGGSSWEGKFDSWGHVKDAVSKWGVDFERILKECKAGTLN